jgi:hypothetical protein
MCRYNNFRAMDSVSGGRRLPFCPLKHGILLSSKTALEAPSYLIICAKRPKLIVCMLQYRQGKNAGKYVSLDSTGVGQVFSTRTHNLEPNLTT